MISCKVSVHMRYSDIIYTETIPNCVIGLIHEKLPHISTVVIDIGMEQSIFSPFKMQFSRILAFNTVVDLKNSFAFSFISIAVTLPLLEATLIIF